MYLRVTQAQFCCLRREIPFMTFHFEYAGFSAVSHNVQRSLTVEGIRQRYSITLSP